MFKRTALSLLACSLTFAACATDATNAADEQMEAVDDRGEPLPVQHDPGDPGTGHGGTKGGGGGGTTTPKTAPHIVGRSVSGTNIVVAFDRALATDELVATKTKVSVVRHMGGGSFAETNLATGMTLSATKKSVSITLSQAVKPGEVYYARSKWKACSSCQEFAAELGEIAVSSVSPLDTASTGNAGVLANAGPGASVPAGVGATAAKAVGGVMAVGTLAGVATAAPLPLVTTMQLDEPVPAVQGTFHIASITPNDLSEGNTREVDKVVVKFDGGTIDCAKTPHSMDGFHLYSITAGVPDQQSMYEDPAAKNTNDFGYRGTFQCDEGDNRIIFTTPGRLYGDAWYRIDIGAWSKEGNFMQKSRDFKTVRPGIVVSATRVENDYGTHDTCDSDGFWGSENYCDIYVTSAIAALGAGQPGRVPEQGDFSEMRYYPSDPIRGERWMSPPRILFATPNAIDQAVDIQLWAFDADSDSEWKKIFSVASTIATAAAAVITPFNPAAGGISTGVAAGFKGLAQAIPTNEDDLLGSGRFLLTRDDSRWGTTSPNDLEMPLSINNPNRGPVKVYLRTEEFPRPWHVSSPIL